MFVPTKTRQSHYFIHFGQTYRSQKSLKRVSGDSPNRQMPMPNIVVRTHPSIQLKMNDTRTHATCKVCQETHPLRYIKLIRPCGCEVCVDYLLQNHAGRGASSLVCSCGVTVNAYIDHVEGRRTSNAVSMEYVEQPPDLSEQPDMVFEIIGQAIDKNTVAIPLHDAWGFTAPSLAAT